MTNAATRAAASRGTMRALFLGAAALAWASCTPTDKPGKDGQLGSDSFFYECATPSDAACDEQPAGTPFEEIPVVALGATFQIKVDPSTHSVISPTPFLEQESAGPEGSTFVAKREGWAVLVSQVTDNTGDETAPDASDLTHVRVVKPVTVALGLADTFGDFQPFDGASGLVLDPMMDQTVRVVPVDDQGTELAGALPCAWTTSDMTIVALSNSADNVVALIPKATAGTATITAKLGDFQTSFDVTIGGMVP